MRADRAHPRVDTRRRLLPGQPHDAAGRRTAHAGAGDAVPGAAPVAAGRLLAVPAPGRRACGGQRLAGAVLRLAPPPPSPPPPLSRRRDGAHAVPGVSPELFFDWRPVPDAERSWLLAAQPMKGTAARGRDKVEDEAAQGHLRTSEKERAENLMIVDLLRNDMSRVAQLGSVRVPRLFELHALPTVWQMTSTVTAVSRPKLRLSELFAALFPCGSVTGAPKVRAMQIIQALEPGPRGWYCGALGLLQPGGVATFNVPIRTVEQDGAALRCGIGSAITLDSEPAAEVAEWRAKTRFLLRAQAPIAALETLRLKSGQYLRLPGHLARLQRTAQHFGLKLPLAAVRTALNDLAAEHVQGAWRVRLTVGARGELELQCQVLPETPACVQLALADTPVDAE